MIEKLNIQAVISASANETEYVKDSLIEFEKVCFKKLCILLILIFNLFFFLNRPLL